jgi:mRNA interferase HigB
MSFRFENNFLEILKVLPLIKTFESYMNVVSYPAIKAFYTNHPNSEDGLNNWYRNSKKANWKDLNELKKDYPSVDYVGNDRYVFNICGNNFRLVARIIFIAKTVQVRFIGTHAEYDKIDCTTI